MFFGQTKYGRAAVAVADITYWLTDAGYLYISLITDAYSRRIMGFALADNLEAVNSRRALEIALKQINKRIGRGLIHHSDRGIQYCCNEYIRAVENYHIQISMTENSDPLENSIAERVNAGPPVRYSQTGISESSTGSNTTGSVRLVREKYISLQL